MKNLGHPAHLRSKDTGDHNLPEKRGQATSASRTPRKTRVVWRGPSHGTSSVADSCLRNSSGVILRNSQKLNAGNFRPKRPYGV